MTTFSLRRDHVMVVGILNVTPDSFSDGGERADVPVAIEHARRMWADGADLIDIGGESTRPGASDVPVAEELRRVLPVIKAVTSHGIAVSIDTRRAAVADAAIRSGASVINDVSGLRDPDMIVVAAEARVPVIIMHAPSADMAETHRHSGYDNVVESVRNFLAQQAERAREAGVPDVAVDPGIGFGKTLEENIELIRHLNRLTDLGHPVMIGASRKRMIGTLTGVEHPKDRDPGSVATHLAAVAKGAHLVRVHDVNAHVQALRIWHHLAP
jgi:dihydropteroate synthase